MKVPDMFCVSVFCWWWVHFSHVEINSVPEFATTNAGHSITLFDPIIDVLDYF